MLGMFIRLKPDIWKTLRWTPRPSLFLLPANLWTYAGGGRTNVLCSGYRLLRVLPCVLTLSEPSSGQAFLRTAPGLRSRWVSGAAVKREEKDSGNVTGKREEVYSGKKKSPEGRRRVDEESMLGLERRRRWIDPWKLKQKRFTRHITNLVRKGKVQ